MLIKLSILFLRNSTSTRNPLYYDNLYFSMQRYLIRGKIFDIRHCPLNDLKVQAMDSDQEWFEDRNDDLLGSSWSNLDGSFEITYEDSFYKDTILEGEAKIYLIIRDKDGQVIHRTDKFQMGEDEKEKGIMDVGNVYLSQEIEIESANFDPYSNNSNRILSAFSSLGDYVSLENTNIQRNLALLLSSINAWLIYTSEPVWQQIQYDGPQVPRYPSKVENHSHKLSWERE